MSQKIRIKKPWNVNYDIESQHWITTFKEELSLADNVYFVGYSDNRYDKANNLPLYYG
mgnify:CR=1 FL=1